MPAMSVTLEVSKLSGWLNADARCRETKNGRAMRGEAQTGRPIRVEIRRFETHPKHLAHVRDA